jgi:hypothetical protein
MATLLSEAWRAVGAAPFSIRTSWSAWAADRSRLVFTLPRPDMMPDGYSIPLWDASWSDDSPGKAEQLRNIREAQAAGVPMVGYPVDMSERGKITDTHPARLLSLKIVEDTNTHIVARIVGVVRG